MELDLRDYIRIVRKRLMLIIIFVLAACIVTAVISYFFVKPVYEASTKLIVNKSNERVGLEQLNINDINVNLRLIDTYKEVIKTSAIMDKVVAGHPEFNLTAEELVKKVRVSSVNNSQVMTLVVQDLSYAKAKNVVNAVSEVFQEEIPTIMKVDNVSILDRAKEIANPTPVKPNPKLNIAISFVIALMAALGIAFLLEYLDDTIKTDADVEQILGLPTLAMISKIEEEDLESAHAHQTKQVGEARNVPINQ
jgi:capsular polysaccharide biosynthesis protein